VSQRESGYERKERDLYETPAWVTLALIRHLPGRLRPGMNVYEPAAGSGKMLRVLADVGFMMDADDISEGRDFLQCSRANHSAIITNPPYNIATEFVTHAIGLTAPQNGIVAMLLRTDFDHAKTRAKLFSECPVFSKKVVLTKRIQWFEESKGSPSFNHAWFIWDWKHVGPPTLGYGPLSEAA
jgi:hypothetical protein